MTAECPEYRTLGVLPRHISFVSTSEYRGIVNRSSRLPGSTHPHHLPDLRLTNRIRGECRHPLPPFFNKDEETDLLPPSGPVKSPLFLVRFLSRPAGRAKMSAEYSEHFCGPRWALSSLILIREKETLASSVQIVARSTERQFDRASSSQSERNQTKKRVHAALHGGHLTEPDGGNEKRGEGVTAQYGGTGGGPERVVKESTMAGVPEIVNSSTSPSGPAAASRLPIPGQLGG